MAIDPHVDPRGDAWRTAAEVVAVIAGIIAIAIVVAVLQRVWTVQPASVSSDLTRYGAVPDDGMATRAVLRTADGEVSIATNSRQLTDAEMSVEWPLEARLGLFDLGTTAGSPAAGYVAIETTITSAVPGQAATRRRAFAAAGPDGMYLLAMTLEGSATVHAFSPPLLVRPSRLTPGAQWQSEGEFGLGGAYRFRAQVEGSEPVAGPIGSFQDCLVITETFELGQSVDALQGEPEMAYSCPDVGEVARRSDASGTRVELLASTRLPGVQGGLPPPVADQALAGPGGPVGDPADWVLSPVGAVAGSRQSSAAAFPPVVLSGPRVVAARAGGALVELDARPLGVGAQWRFHASNNVGGALDASPDGRVLLLGATDKSLYALNDEGMLLWSRTAHDAITGVVATDDGGAIVASEDRTVTALNADGTQRWRIATGGPVTASPVVSEDGVVVAAEDGAVRILEVATGKLLHRIDLGEPVTADVTVHRGVAAVATREGQLVAIDVAAGRVRWRARTGGEIVERPAVAADRVVVVSAGALHAYAFADGAPLAGTPARGYVGGPAPTSAGVLVATAGGTVDLLDERGAVRRSWAAPPRGGVFDSGFVLGAGAAWAIDSSGTVYRLGPSRPGDAAGMTPVWSRDLADPSLLSAGAVPAYPAIAAPEGGAVLLDFNGTVQYADPDDGALRMLGRVDGVDDPAGGGVIAGGVLVVGTRNSLHAVTYPGLEPLWSRDGLGGSAGAPVIAGDTVYWAVADAGADGALTSARLLAIALPTGEVRWESPATKTIVATGVLVAGDLVIAGHEPAAFEVETGRRVWSLSAFGPGLGRPAVSPDGRTVAVASLALTGSDGARVRLVDAATGEIRQTLDLPRGSAMDASDGIRWDDTSIVVPQLDGGVVAFNDDGSQRWAYQPPIARFGDLGHTPAAVWFELVDGRVVVLDVDDGSVLARDVAADEQHDVNAATSKPAAVGGVMVVADGTTIRAYDATVGATP